jgi:hypothetical protein
MKENAVFPDEKYTLINDPRWLAPFVIFLGLCLYKRATNKIKPTYVFIALVPLALIFGIFTTKQIFSQVSSWKKTGEEYKTLFAFKKTMTRSDRVFTDYSTHQCFVGHNKLYCVDRLPCYIDPTANRFYPQNTHLLESLFTDGSLIAVNRISMEKLSPLIKSAGFAEERINEMGTFEIVKLHRIEL